MTVTKNDIKTVQKDKTGPKVTADVIDEEVYKALEMKDFNTVVEMVMNSFDKETTTLACRRRVIEVLTKEEMIEEAAKLATMLAQWFRNPRAIRFRELFNNIIEKMDDQRKEEFRSSLNPVLVAKLRDFK